jgi:UDP-N-acetylglucosamine 4,6-dehydratase (inverting)
MINNKTIFITGGTGSFGTALIKKLLANYKARKIIIFSRDEFKQYNLKLQINKNYHKYLRFFIGDVRDEKRVNDSIKNNNVDIVVHAAALKHVPAIEYNPFEAIKTNILGAQNLISACIDSNVKKVIALSTDKAAAPINLYGATKLASDKLFVAANNYSGRNNFASSVVRYGNVMGSRGSVIPFFLENRNKKHLEITNLKMTRFNITLDQSVSFVIKCLQTMIGGEIFVPKISSYRITDLAKAISPKSKLKIIGLRAGEKLHEEMITISDAQNTIDCKDYYIILPHSDYVKSRRNRILKRNGKKFCKENFFYNSKYNNQFLSVQDLRTLIKNNVILK